MALSLAASLLACSGRSGFDGSRYPQAVDRCHDIECVAPDACHDVGWCDPTTGLCSHPAKMNGTACDDGNPCSAIDTCQGGVCIGSPIPQPINNVIFVWAAAPLPNDGRDWCHAYPDLHDALAAARAGDSIWVAAGTYVPGTTPEDSFFPPAGVGLYGGFAGNETSLAQRDWTANPTILSGDLNGDDAGDANRDDNSHTIVEYLDVDATAVLDGFVVRGGNAVAASRHTGSAAGVYLSDASPTLLNCRFEANTAEQSGGAVYGYASSSPTLEGITFSGNRAGENGGAMYHQGNSATLKDCHFEDNHAHYGGALFNSSSVVTVSGSVFLGNTADSNGGAIISYSTTRIVNSVFLGCSSGNEAGAVHVEDGTLWLANGLFSGNVSFRGGALAISGAAQATLSNCSFANNRATSSVGAAIRYRSTAAGTVENSVFGAHTTAAIVDENNVLVVNYSCIESHWTGNGSDNLAVAPGFANVLGPDAVAGTLDDDLRLNPTTSQAIDAGDNSAVLQDLFDLDGDAVTAEATPIDLAGLPRFHDAAATPDTGNGSAPIVDMGAHEAVP
jgi:predicted outer membrane repeat protein